MDSNTQTIVVVNVISTSYSGSTWVNLMLGSHSQAFSVGEFKHVVRSGQAVCSLHGESCPFWGGYQYDQSNPFLWISQKSGRRFLIVNNSRNTLRFQQHERIHSRFVHLLRDGCAVVASRLRKKRSKSVWAAARMWTHNVRRNRRLIRRQHAEDAIEIKYEDLVDDPGYGLERLCGFLDLPFEPEMREYWQVAHHFIGGSLGTISSLASKRRSALPDIPKWRNLDEARRHNLTYYDKVDPSTFVDERWKKELTDWQLLVFGLIAGRLNRKVGYLH